jgi:hypothetical protein
MWIGSRCRIWLAELVMIVRYPPYYKLSRRLNICSWNYAITHKLYYNITIFFDQQRLHE